MKAMDLHNHSPASLVSRFLSLASILGLVSPTSTSGGLYPKKLLLDAGLRPGKDVRIKWFGSHAKVAKV